LASCLRDRIIDWWFFRNGVEQTLVQVYQHSKRGSNFQTASRFAERQNHRAAASDLVKCKQRTTAAPVHFIVMPLLN